MGDEEDGKLVPASRALQSDPGWSKWYANNSILRGIVNLVPYVGGAIDTVLSIKADQLHTQRVEALFTALEEEMGLINIDKVSSEYFESEEGMDLLISTVEAAKKTKNKEKIKLYAKILRGATTLQAGDLEPHPEVYLAILAELSLRELTVAKLIYDFQKEEYQANSGLSELQWVSKSWKEFEQAAQVFVGNELDFVLQRLSKTGLIREITGTYFDYMGGVFTVTLTFRGLMCFVGEDWPGF